MSAKGPKQDSTQGGGGGDDGKDPKRPNNNTKLPADAPDFLTGFKIAPPRTEEEQEASEKTTKWLQDKDDQPLDLGYTFSSKRPPLSSDDGSDDGSGTEKSSSPSTKDRKDETEKAGKKRSLSTSAKNGASKAGGK